MPPLCFSIIVPHRSYCHTFRDPHRYPCCPRHRHHHPFRNPAPSIVHPHPTTQPVCRLDPNQAVEAVDSHLQSLCADTTLEATTSRLTSTSLLPSTWPFVLHALAAASIIGITLSRIVTRFGLIPLLNLPPHNVKSVTQQLLLHLSLTHAQRKRILSHHPNLLSHDAAYLVASINALRHVGLDTGQIRHITLRWPNILQLPSAHIRRVAMYLTRPPLKFPPHLVVSLIRRAPWFLDHDVDSEIVPVVNWLHEFIPSKSLYTILLANPILVRKSRGSLFASYQFLGKVILLDDLQRIAAVRSFPHLLTCAVDTVLQPAFEYLTRNIAIRRIHVGKMVRAFPSILTLDVDTAMKPVIQYFHNRGVRNVARIVRRLPPILGYDIKTNIDPKMRFILDDLRLDTFHVLIFPGLFSYSLEKRIKPRTRLLLILGKPISKIGLGLVISSTDEEFCTRVANVPLRIYAAYYRTVVGNTGKQTQSSNRSARAKSRRSKSSMDRLDASHGPGTEERSVWGKKRFRATLKRIPRNELR